MGIIINKKQKGERIPTSPWHIPQRNGYPARNTMTSAKRMPYGRRSPE